MVPLLNRRHLIPAHKGATKAHRFTVVRWQGIIATLLIDSVGIFSLQKNNYIKVNLAKKIAPKNQAPSVISERLPAHNLTAT